MDITAKDILFSLFCLVALYMLTVKVVMPFLDVVNIIKNKIKGKDLSLGEKLIESYKIWLLSSKKNHSLRYLSKKMVEDKKFLIEFLIKNDENIPNIDKCYLKDKDFLLELMGKINAKYFKLFDKDLTKDKDFVFKALNTHAFYIYEVDEFLRNDKEVGLLAVNRMAASYEVLSESLRNDNDIIVATINNCPTYFSQLTEEGRDNEKYVLEALKALENSNDKYKKEHTEELLESSSERIQKICKCLDPIKALESAIFAKELSATLVNKSSQTTNKVYKI